MAHEQRRSVRVIVDEYLKVLTTTSRVVDLTAEDHLRLEYVARRLKIKSKILLLGIVRSALQLDEHELLRLVTTREEPHGR